MLEGQLLDRSRLGDGYAIGAPQAQSSSSAPFYPTNLYEIGKGSPPVHAAERQVGFWQPELDPTFPETARTTISADRRGLQNQTLMDVSMFDHNSEAAQALAVVDQNRPKMRKSWGQTLARGHDGNTAAYPAVLDAVGCSPRWMESGLARSWEAFSMRSMEGHRAGGVEDSSVPNSGFECNDKDRSQVSQESADCWVKEGTTDDGTNCGNEKKVDCEAHDSCDEKDVKGCEVNKNLEPNDAGDRSILHRGQVDVDSSAETGTRQHHVVSRAGIDIPRRDMDNVANWLEAERDFETHLAYSGRGTHGAVQGSTDLHGALGMFSSSFPEHFQNKLTLSDSSQFRGHSVESGADLWDVGVHDDHEPFLSLQEMESRTIGKLLPDDEEELLADVTAEMADMDLRTKYYSTEDAEDFDLFSSSGGLELGDVEGFDGSFGSSRTVEQLIGIPPAGASGAASNNVAGEHPFGEHPSRTLFVRNINSNVDDAELRELFEKYGAIRTLYTACKHRGFVMISYYDIRAAKNAMRALQNKPLRRRKLDIHFSIPKENPSDKDVNQGTLVVFNLDASVGNDELRTIFGHYGEIKEIRETPHKRHHKFIEFYDVRAAEQALRALNRSDIAGKRIKLEPSRPGGTRRSLMQQLSAELAEEENRPQRLSPLSPYGPGSPPTGGSPWAVGSPKSMDLAGGNMRGISISHQSPAGGGQYGAGALFKSPAGASPLSSSMSLLERSQLGLGLPAHPSSPPVHLGQGLGQHSEVRDMLGLPHLGQVGLQGTQHPQGHGPSSGFSNQLRELRRLPPHHPHSLPEYGSGLLSPLSHFGGAAMVSPSSMAQTLPRHRDPLEMPSRLHRTSSGSHLGGSFLSEPDSLAGHSIPGMPYSSSGGSSMPSSAFPYHSTSGASSSGPGGGAGASAFLQAHSLNSSLACGWPPLPSQHSDRGSTPGSFDNTHSTIAQLHRSLSLNTTGSSGAPSSQHHVLSHSLSHSALGQLSGAGGHLHGLGGSGSSGGGGGGHAPFSLQHSLSQTSLSQSHAAATQAHSPRMLSFGGSVGAHGLGLASSLHHLSRDPQDSVGSAPLLDCRYNYMGESPDLSGRVGSLGGLVGLDSGASGPPSPNIGLMSPPTKGGYFESRRSLSHGGTSGLSGLTGGGGGEERGGGLERGPRNKRGSEVPGALDSRKQFQLDLDRIMRGEDPRTTLMIKNIPNKYTQKMLLAAIDEHHRGTYDFFYLPIDFKNKCNVGYAFINMIDPAKIVPFFQAFNGKKWEKFNSEKVANLAYARIQGKNALVAHFQNSSLMNEDKRCRPILFHSQGPHMGDQEPFPTGSNSRVRQSRGSTGSAAASAPHMGSPSNSTTSSSREESSHGGNLFGTTVLHRTREGGDWSPERLEGEKDQD